MNFIKFQIRKNSKQMMNFAILTVTFIIVILAAHANSSILSKKNNNFYDKEKSTTSIENVPYESVQQISESKLHNIDSTVAQTTVQSSNTELTKKLNNSKKNGKYHHHQRHNRHYKKNDLSSEYKIDDFKMNKRPYRSKYTIEELLRTKFEYKVSNDIDMDPCKAGGFMGDIALPDGYYGDSTMSRYAEEGLPQSDAPTSDADSIKIYRTKYNTTFQEELEILKKEVYHEGLQVEEEGLTDIIRRKTKLPSENINSKNSYDNNEAINEPYKISKQAFVNKDFIDNNKNNFKNDILNSQHRLNKDNTEEDYYDEVNKENRKKYMESKMIKNVDILPINKITANGDGILEKNYNIDQQTFAGEKNLANIEHEKTIKDIKVGFHNRNVDQRKIQSNTKDIEDDSGNNFVAERKFVILPTSLPTHRTTLPNVYSNAGGNGFKMDNIEFLHANGAVRRRRHRDRHSNRRNADTSSEYKAKLKRLRDELIKSIPDESNEKYKKQSYHITENPIAISNLQTTLKKKKLQQLNKRHRTIRAVTAKKERIWDYGVIPYEIDGNFTGVHKALFKQAMRHWENSTCIKFVERDPEIHPNYIVFTVRSCGCCSFVGKRGNGPQAISIGRNCDKFGIVVHELGHVVGFWHEHTRPDREKHVVIELNNIMKGQDYNFNKLTPEEVDSLGMAYDYDSIMHYARNTFSKGTYLDTILPIEIKGRKRPEIGQRLRLSAGDIAQANLLYKCPKCGRTFQENTGFLATPSYYTAGALSNETENCEWRITATHGERVILRLENLNILKSNNCQTDYLEVRDGYYYKSPLLGRFCGKLNSNELTTTSSRMLLTYVNTHRSEGYRGFRAEYEVICGGELSVDDFEGRLESPNYPLDYLPNKECIWKITVPKGYQVALKFQSFEVENHDSCVYDYVEVRDGLEPDSTLIGVFCGYKPPPNMKSSGNTMFIKFVSDTSVQKAGFSAVFMKEVDECETQNHGCEHECINTLGGYECGCHIGFELHSDKKHCEDACGGVIEYPNGTISSPSFPDKYPVLKECIWEIIAAPKHTISLNFTHFDLEGTTHQQTDCGYDSVTLYSKLKDNRLKRIGTYCGTGIPPTATSESNTLRVEFHSDKSIQRSGFAAVFFTDIDECTVNNGGCQHDCRNTIGSYMCICHNGYSLHENAHDCKEGECKHEITAPFGDIYSPNYPDDYPPNADCVWHFSTTPGHRIKLIFNNFNVESHQECTYDNIALYDGESDAYPILGRFCGEKIPYPISSTTNQLYMVLKTDKNKQLNGFHAVHSTSCGGYLRATSQTKQFYSHARFGHHNYNDNMDCEWTLQAPSSSNVQLIFLTFDIESSENCSFDYVQVYSGMEDTSGPMYGQFCGNVIPQEIISLTDSLLVRFKTDSSLALKGFSASYVAVDPFENSEEDANSYSSEIVTPFPGSLKSIYKEEDETDDDYSDFSENQLIVNHPYRTHSRYAMGY